MDSKGIINIRINYLDAGAKLAMLSRPTVKLRNALDASRQGGLYT